MIRKYLSIYLSFLSQCFTEAMSYRVHFFLLMIMDLLFYLSVFGSVDFIFDHVKTIGPWGYQEFMFFISFIIAVDHLNMTFVSESFWNLSRDIRTGDLDFVLLKPVPTLFPIFFRFIRPGTLLNGIVPWSFLIYFGIKLNLSVTSWLLLPILTVSAFTLSTAIGILISMSMFWTIESFGINFLRMQLQQLSRWPDFIYQSMSRRFFSFVLPVLLIGSTPIKFLIDNRTWLDLLIMHAFIVLIFLVIHYLWKKGLASYESASS